MYSYVYLIGLLFIHWSVVAQATELTFNPATPVVQVGGQITLTVSGSSGEITWSPLKGQIQGTGNQVIYLAPEEPGIDVVTVLDSVGNLGTLKITLSIALEVKNLTLQRAAIIVAGGNMDATNPLWDTTEAISNSIYQIFIGSGFADEDIYYVSPKSWADVDKDGSRDYVVDAPNPERALMAEDIEEALTWAKTRGNLGQPLYLFIIAGASSIIDNALRLNQEHSLELGTLKTLLDTYQSATGNSVVLVTEVCHGGDLLKSLAAPQRAIISSTGEQLAYFNSEKATGFSYFLLKVLGNRNFYEAFTYASGEQQKMLKELSSPESEVIQDPQLDDNGDGVFTDQDGQWLKQVRLTKTPKLFAGTILPLKAKVNLVDGAVAKVWASIKPPQTNAVMGSEGIMVPLATTTEENIWEATWLDTVYDGEYNISFLAQDSQGQVASSSVVKMNITEGTPFPGQPSVQVTLTDGNQLLAKTQYQFGERFTATLTEQLSWGYDLYAAVLLPDGQTFVTLKTLNEFAPLNQPQPWQTQRVQTQPLTLIDMTLPDTLPTGQYCLFGILSPAGGEVFETLNQGLWVSETKCFEIF